MKKILFSFFALLLTGFVFGQTVSIGTGTASTFSTSTSATSAQSPWNPYYGYTYAQTIYLQSEINASGNISSISYYFAGSSISNNADIKVWMKEVTKSSFASTTDWEATSGMTLVYDGTFSGTVPGWVEIQLQNQFAYTNTGNLLIAIDENTTGDNGTSGFRYSATAANSNRVIFYRSDGTNPDPSSPPTANGRSNQIGNIQINGLTLVGCQPPTSLNGTYNAPDGNFDWQPPAGGSAVTQYNWEYRTSGAAGSGATGLVSSGNTNTTSVVINNPVSGTFYVRSDCGAGTYSPWQNFVLNIPPSNDEPCGAVLLTAGTSCSYVNSTLVNATGSTTTLGGPIPAPGCASYGGGDVWFKVGVPASGGLIFDSDTSGIPAGFIADGGMAIYSSSDNTCDGLFTLIECDDDDSDNGALSKIIRSGLNPGDTIFIRFWEYGNDNRGSFSICVQELPMPPANDDCAGAVTLTVNADLTCTATANGTTLSATPSSESAPSCSAGGINDDVWYKFTATGASHVISLSGATNTTAIALYDGCGGNQLTDACASTTLTANGLNPSTEYYVRVYTTSTTVNANFTICVGTPPAPPANDDCTDAATLTVNSDLNCGITTNGSTLSATESAEAAPSCSATGINDDVWYKFTATSTVHRISVSGTTSTVAVALYDGCGGNQLTGACASTTLNATGLTPGTEYYVRVYTTSASSSVNSAFVICVGTPPPPPANDEPCGAVLLTAGASCNYTNATSAFATGSTATTGGPIPAPGCASYTTGDVWFKVVVPATGHLVFDSDTSNAAPGFIDDGGMAIYSSSDNTCDGVFTLIECDDDDSENGALSKIDRTGLNPGDTIYIRFWDYDDIGGTFSVCVVEPPAPPACVTIIAPADGATAVSTPVTLSWNADATATAYDVYLGTANPPTGTVATNLTTTSFTYNAAGFGQTYYWYVRPENAGGNATGCDAIIYSFTTDNPPPAPGNDECATPTVLTPSATAACTPISGTTASATASNETAPSCSATGVNDDVWYSFTAINANHLVNISNASNTTAVAVYEGGCGALTQLAGACATTTAGSRTLRLTGLVVGNTYYVRVYSSVATATTFSNFDICVSTLIPAVNDDCSGATTLVSGITINDSSTLATQSIAPVTCGTFTSTAANDVWYKVTPGQNGNISFSASSSSDLVVAAYSGDCNNLTYINCDDSGNPEEVSIASAVAGTNYYFRVYVYGNNIGNFSVTATGSALPVTLADFNGTRVGGINKLSWTTKTEVNNAGFELQRSADGRNFTKLGYVAAKSENGNSTRELNYSFNDTKPYAGVSYYRLNQVDKDGKSTLSNVVAIKGDKLNEVQFSAVYPNPAKDRLNVILASPKAERVTLVVTDLSGKVIKQQIHNAVEGNNNIEVNVNSLSAGTYIIKLVCASGCETAVQKFMKN